MPFPRSVRLREVGPREGFQAHPQVVETARKLALVEALVATGVKEIEVTSFVRPDRVPQMADAEQLVAQLKPSPGVTYSALYLNQSGFRRAEQCPQLQNRGWLYSAASETFLQRNNNLTHEGFLERVPAWLHCFQQAGKTLHGVMISTAFGCALEGKGVLKKVVPHLRRIDEVVRTHGGSIREVSLADTVGLASPTEVREMVAAVRAVLPSVEISLHLHDTRGTGMANVYAGLEEGVELFECSVGGMGGCPFTPGAAGNVPTEDVAYLCATLGIETGVDLDAYAAAAQLAEQILGAPLPGRYYRSISRGQASLLET